MSNRFTLLLSGAAMLALSLPASAQDEPTIHADRVEVVDTVGGYDGEWQGQWQDDGTWSGTWDGIYTAPGGDELAGEYGVHIERHSIDLGASPDGRLGYSLAEREAWLDDCRLLMAGHGGYARYDDRDDDFGGGLIGGLLGAVVGGFAGNRIDDAGSRLAGTLIGAGIGGVAGAVIGSLIDGADDDRYEGRQIDANELWAARYCDAYLRRYEMGGGAGFAGQMSYGQPVMMMQTVAAGSPHGQHGHRHGPECTTTVREEWVEVEGPSAAPPPARRVIPPLQPSGKTVPIH